MPPFPTRKLSVRPFPPRSLPSNPTIANLPRETCVRLRIRAKWDTVEKSENSVHPEQIFHWIALAIFDPPKVEWRNTLLIPLRYLFTGLVRLQSARFHRNECLHSYPYLLNMEPCITVRRAHASFRIKVKSLRQFCADFLQSDWRAEPGAWRFVVDKLLVWLKKRFCLNI